MLPENERFLRYLTVVLQFFLVEIAVGIGYGVVDRQTPWECPTGHSHRHQLLPAVSFLHPDYHCRLDSAGLRLPLPSPDCDDLPLPRRFSRSFLNVSLLKV